MFIILQELLSSLEAELRPVSWELAGAVQSKPQGDAAAEQATARPAKAASVAPAPEPESESHEARPATHTEDSEVSETAAARSTEGAADSVTTEPGQTQSDTNSSTEVEHGDTAEGSKAPDMEIPTPDASAPRTSSYRGTIRLEAAQSGRLSASFCLPFSGDLLDLPC